MVGRIAPARHVDPARLPCRHPPSFLVEAQVVQPLDVNLPFLFPSGTNSVIGPFTTLEVWVTNTVSGQAYLDQMDLLRQPRTFSLVADGVPLQRLVPATNAVGTFWLKGPFLPQAAVETLREAAKTKASVALDLLPKALGHLPAGKYTLTMKLGPPPADSLAGRYAAQASGPIPARPVAWTGALVVADVSFTIGAAGDASPTPATLADALPILAAAAGGQWKLTGHWLAGTYDGHLRYSIIPNPQTSADGRTIALELVTRHSFRQQVIGISEQFLLIGTGDAGAEVGVIAKQLGLTLLIEPLPNGGHKLLKQTVTFGGATNTLTACSLKEFMFAPNPGAIESSNGLAGGGKRWDHPPVLEHGVDSPANLLVAAAKQGDNAALERLLDEGTPSDARNADGQSALELAVANGHREAVLVLLGRGAPLWGQNAHGESLLHIAVGARQPEMLELLLALGVPQGLADAKGRTPLDLARQFRTADMVDALRRLKPVDLKKPSRQCSTPIAVSMPCNCPPAPKAWCWTPIGATAGCWRATR